MVDFNKLREDNKKRAALLASQPPAPPKPTELSRVKHMLAHHLGEMTEWEAGFCYDNRLFLTENPSGYMSQRASSKLAEIEALYCGSFCHALNKAGVPHG